MFLELIGLNLYSIEFYFVDLTKIITSQSANSFTNNHDFSVLIQNFNSKLNNFKPLSQSLNDVFIRSINKFRVIGNSRAHNIELSNAIVKKKIDEKFVEFTHILEILVRLLNNG